MGAHGVGGLGSVVLPGGNVGAVPAGVLVKFLIGMAFLAIIAGAVFAIQNSAASPVTMKFLHWRLETSLLYCILGSMAAGMLIVILLWIPRAIRGSLSGRTLRKENQILKQRLAHGQKDEEPEWTARGAR
jgi:uncharacterized integral membrane protein